MQPPFNGNVYCMFMMVNCCIDTACGPLYQQC